MQNFTPIEFQQARDFSKKLNATFEFIQQNFKSLGKSLLYIAGPVALIGSLLTGGLYSDYLNAAFSIGRNTDGLMNFIGSPKTWAQGAGSLIFILISAIFIVSVVYNYMLEYNARKSNRIEVDAVWTRVRQTLPAYFVTFFLFFVLILSAYALAFLVIGGLGIMSIGLAVLAVFVVAVLLVYLIVPLSLIFVIRAFEKIGFVEAVHRSFLLIKGKWWSTFALLFVAGLVQSMLASVFFIPWYINSFITMLHALDGQVAQQPSLISQLINNVFIVLYFLASFLLYAIPLIALAFQYFNLVELKESRGLMNRIEQMGNPY